MASLRGLLQGLLDKTSADENVRKSVGTFVRNPVQSAATFGKAIWNGPVLDVGRSLATGPGYYLKTLPYARNLANQQSNRYLQLVQDAAKAQQMGNYGLGKQLQTQGLGYKRQAQFTERAATQLPSFPDIAASLFQGKPLQPSLRGQAALQSATSGARTIFAGRGLANPALMAKALPVSLGLGGGITALTGGNLAQGLGEATGAVPRVAGLTSLTQPYIDRAFSKLPQAAPIIQKAATKFAVGGITNLAEDQLYSLATEGRVQNIAENIFSVGFGGIMGTIYKTPEGKIKEVVFEDKSKMTWDSGAKRWRTNGGKFATAAVKWIGEQKTKLNEPTTIRVFKNGEYVEEIVPRWRAEWQDPKIGLGIKVKGTGIVGPAPKTQAEAKVKLPNIAISETSPHQRLNETQPPVIGKPTTLTSNIPPKGVGEMGGVSAVQPKLQVKTQPPKLKATKPINQTAELQTPSIKSPEKIRVQQPTTSTANLKTTKQPSSIGIVPQKKKGKLNVERLNLDDQQKATITELQDKVPVTVLGNKEVINKAVNIKSRTMPMTDEEMANRIAAQLNSRQAVVSKANELKRLQQMGASQQEKERVIMELAKQSQVANTGGTFAGRLLQAQKIIANELATPQQKVLGLLDNAGIKPEKYAKDAANVDWDNAQQVTSFYRKYVPPSLGEVLDEYRYTNMLSSPQTHINNAASNFIQTGIVAPIEKTVTGSLDWVKSALTGKERQYYASQGIDYTKGYWKSLPEAFRKFKSVMAGGMPVSRPDVETLPISTKTSYKIYTTPLRMLEASDQFFRTMTTGGEMEALKRAGKMGPEALEQATKTAEYRLFREAFGENGNKGVLGAWDKYNSAVMQLRRAPGGKWIVPFIRTPTNILKQGLEYSPAGLVTIPGSKAPLEQLSKTIIGSAVFSAAYSLADSGLTTWDVPTDKKQKELYYAAGLQPYSVKIGDKWVSYSKLGPLSYPLAMAAALKYLEKTKPDQTMPQNVGETMVQMLKFFGDQSYVKNIGDFIEAVTSADSNKMGAGIGSQVANVASQLVPYRSFLGWVARTIDPVYRDANTLTEKVISQIPGLSEKVPPYMTPFGGESKRDYPILNAVSPYKVSKEKPEEAELYKTYEQAKIEKGVLKREKDKLEAEVRKEYGQTKASDDVYSDKNDPATELKLDIAKEKVKLKGGVETVGDYKVFPYKGETKTIDTSRINTLPTEPEETGYEEVDKEARSTYKSELSSIVNDVRALYETDQISLEEYAAKLKEIDDLYKATNAKGKKAKKLKFKKAPVPKRSSIKMPSFKSPTTPTLKLSKPLVGKLKVSPVNTKIATTKINTSIKKPSKLRMKLA